MRDEPVRSGKHAAGAQDAKHFLGEGLFVRDVDDAVLGKDHVELGRLEGKRSGRYLYDVYPVLGPGIGDALTGDCTNTALDVDACHVPRVMVPDEKKRYRACAATYIQNAAAAKIKAV